MIWNIQSFPHHACQLLQFSVVGRPQLKKRLNSERMQKDPAFYCHLLLYPSLLIPIDIGKQKAIRQLS